MKILRYALADLFTWIADLCDRIDTRYADACNTPGDDPWT